MNFFKENKATVIIIIIGLGFLVFYSSSKSPEEDITTTITLANTDTGEREMLELFTDMKTIRLDSRIFENDTYVNLQDFSRDIIAEPVGRQDPFAPLENTSVHITGGENLPGDVLLR
jgi:hypothetical protein